MQFTSLVSTIASVIILLISGLTPVSAQSRPFTIDYPLGSRTLARSSYSPLSATAQVASAYQRILGRKAAVYEMALWLRDAKPGLQSRLMIALLASPEFTQRTGGTHAGFIDGTYNAILKRSPIASERQFQLGRLANLSINRDQIAKDLVLSCEHAGILAQEAYSVLLGRSAPAGSSVVWCPGLQAGQLDVLWLDLLSSDEYYARHGRSARGLAAALYRDTLWRDGGGGEIAHIANLIVNQGMTRRQIARIFLDSGEFAAYWALLCPGQWIDTTGHFSADAAINACIAVPTATRLELPAGFYRIDHGVQINKSDFVLTTENLLGRHFTCERDFPACARLVVASGGSLSPPMLQVSYNTARVTIDHVIIDGNRDTRTAVVASICGAGGGRNVIIYRGDDHRFQFSASVNTLCGTALAVGLGGSERYTAQRNYIVHNYINNSGTGYDVAYAQWSDGMTVSYASDSLVAYNEINESSDVALIIGNSPRTIVTRNVIRQLSKRLFAGMMDTNWNTFEPNKGFGDSRGLIVSENEVLVGDLADFGIHIGLGPWSDPAYKSLLRVMGGWYERNNVIGSKQGINIDLAGTPDYPVTLISNIINRLGHGRERPETPIGYFSLPFTGAWSTRTTSAINVSRPWDHSFVSTGGESPELTAYPWS